MSSEDDWEPLPDAAQSAHPGERVEVAARPVPPPAAPAMAPGRDIAADVALRALHNRIAKAPPSASLVAQVMRREQEAERQRAASAASRPAPRPAPTSPPPAVATAPEFAAPPLGPEDEAWFSGLPAAEQERLRLAWSRQEQRLQLDTPWRRRGQNRRSAAALAVFAAVAVLGGASAWLALGAGGVCAVWWRNKRPDWLGDAAAAITCFFVAHAISACVNGGVSPSVVFDSLLVTALSALIGYEGEMRASGGFVEGPRPGEIAGDEREAREQTKAGSGRPSAG
ncbi:MAG: hypothetical protein H6838_05175 [Planctomycetes bacterium]|nr:hypothetical protein [Planctomycetota bacterium]